MKLNDLPKEIQELYFDEWKIQNAQSNISLWMQWKETRQGHDFWSKVIGNGDFSEYYRLYPKTEPEWQPKFGEEIIAINVSGQERKRKFICSNEGLFYVVKDTQYNVNSFENGTDFLVYSVDEIRQIPPKIKLTIAEIAEKFGLKPEEIEII